jgi:hypothetical protein
METQKDSPMQEPWKRANADWLRDAKFGVMLHYLADPTNAENSAADSVEEWNRRVDAFDVPALVGMLQQVHAGYLLFTVGQFSGYYCSPNATFDRIVGIQPSRCSNRDLVGEIAVALAPTGIRLIVYSMATGPMWHRNVHGWWIDACYYPEKMYYFDDEPNFRSFARALKAGNPDSLVSFSLEGAVTWDVPIASTGVVPEIFVRQLAAIGSEARDNRS